MTYFQPLRRKCGVLTLFLTCVFMAGWVRSVVVSDDVIIRISTKGQETLQSEHGRLLWGSFVVYGPGREFEPMQVVLPRWSSKPLSPSDVSFFGIFESMPQGWHLCGAGRYQTIRHFPLLGQVEIVALAIPYWSIVFPLISLSAWLLLSRHEQQPRTVSATVCAGYSSTMLPLWKSTMKQTGLAMLFVSFATVADDPNDAEKYSRTPSR